MNPYREPHKPTNSRLREFFVNRVRRVTPATIFLAAVLIAGITMGATAALRVNGLKIGPNGDFYVTVYGADPTGATDSTTAIQSAITAANTAILSSTIKGATIYFPPGKYAVSAPLNAQGTSNLRFEGSSGLGAGFGGGAGAVNPGSTIIYSGTGATAFLQLNSAFASVVTKLAILYSSASFTGVLIDYGNTGSGDAVYNIIDQCLLGGTTATAWNAKALVSWQKADFNVLKNSHLQGGLSGVRFREGNNDYSNANRIEDNLFRDFQTGHIMNAGSNEVIERNVFEGNLNRGPPLDAPVYTSDLTADGATTDAWCKSLSFVDNWVGDFQAGDTFFDTSPSSLVTCYNLRFESNSIPGTLHFANLRGASIKTNDLGTAVTFDGAGTYTGVSVLDNTWLNAVTFNNMPATAFVKGNTRSISTTVVGDQMNLNGTLTCTGETVNGTVTATSVVSNTVNSNGASVQTLGGSATTEIITNANANIYLGSSSVSGSGFAKTFNNFYVSANDATSGAQLQATPFLYLWANYWNGSVTTSFLASWRHIMDSTGPLSHVQLNINSNTEWQVNSAGAITTRVGANVASGTTIAPLSNITHITGTTTIQTITAPSTFATSGLGGCLILVFDGVAPWNAAGNIFVAGTPTTAGTFVEFCYDNATSKFYPSRTL